MSFWPRRVASLARHGSHSLSPHLPSLHTSLLARRSQCAGTSQAMSSSSKRRRSQPAQHRNVDASRASTSGANADLQSTLSPKSDTHGKSMKKDYLLSKDQSIEGALQVSKSGFCLPQNQSVESLRSPPFSWLVSCAFAMPFCSSDSSSSV